MRFECSSISKVIHSPPNTDNLPPRLLLLSYLRLRPVFGAYLIADIHTESESKFLACIPHWYSQARSCRPTRIWLHSLHRAFLAASFANSTAGADVCNSIDPSSVSLSFIVMFFPSPRPVIILKQFAADRARNIPRLTLVIPFVLTSRTDSFHT